MCLSVHSSLQKNDRNAHEAARPLSFFWVCRENDAQVRFLVDRLAPAP